MAWLLHEPRLRAEVPVFCVVGVKPLLCNNQSPVSVSVGAVHLLTHLHTRLEVLVKNEDIGADFEHVSDGDTPVLWEVRFIWRRPSNRTTKYLSCKILLYFCF